MPDIRRIQVQAEMKSTRKTQQIINIAAQCTLMYKVNWQENAQNVTWI